MSEARPPLGPRGDHPDEALAAFADGTATPDERALVLGHLQGCPACRHEIELARQAIAALASLPEPESPALDPAAIVRRAGNVVGIEPAGRSPRRRGRLGGGLMAGGLASGLVAAGIAVVLATGLIKLGGGGGGASTAAGGEGRGPHSAAPGVGPSASVLFGSNGIDYTPQTIDRLAANEATRAATGGPEFSPAAPSHAVAVKAEDAALSCTNPQTADGSRPLVVYLAHFQGRPAFVAVLTRGEGDQGFVRVVVTDRQTCSVLYSTSAEIPSG